MWLQDKVASGDLQIKQVKTALNIADLNTKPLSRDRYFCLLYMFNFSAGGERVGETEYARMQTKELLKQQVRIVSEVVVESGHATQTTKLHKFAKQILRVLASCSLMSLAEGQSNSGIVNDVSSFGMDTAEALGQGLWLSPITLALFVAMFILLGVLVVFMVPGEGEPEPEEKLKRCRTRTCNGAIDITVPNEQPSTGTCLCKYLRRPHVQSGRHAGLDVP